MLNYNLKLIFILNAVHPKEIRRCQELSQELIAYLRYLLSVVDLCKFPFRTVYLVIQNFLRVLKLHVLIFIYALPQKDNEYQRKFKIVLIRVFINELKILYKYIIT